MRICPKCGVPQEEESFLSKRAHTWYKVCCPCRRREKARLRMASKRALDAYVGDIRMRAGHTQEVRDASLAAARLKRLKTRFLQVTAGMRARIRVMEKNPNPKARTEKALVARKDALARYVSVYERQRAMVDSGVMPGDILEYL